MEGCVEGPNNDDRVKDFESPNGLRTMFKKFQEVDLRVL